MNRFRPRYLLLVILTNVAAGAALHFVGSKPSVFGFALGLLFGWFLRSIVDE